MRISLAALFCGFAILTLGFALQIDACQRSKALVAIVLAIIFCLLSLTSKRIALLIPAVRSSVLRRCFVLVFVAYTLIAVAALRVRHPPIDVLEFEVDSAQALLRGTNPYGANVTHQDICYGHPEICHGAQFYGQGVSANGRVHVGLQYPPLVVFWIIPGYLAGDVRYAWLLALDLAAALLFGMTPDLNGLGAAFLVLFASPSIYVLSLGYTEPLLLLGLAATVFAAHRNPRLLPFAFGLFLSSKQYALLALPLAVLLLPRFSWKQYLALLAKACSVAAITLIPFLIWDPRGLWWSLVTFLVLLPFRTDALSFSAALVTHGLPSIPQWFVALATMATTALALWKAPRTPSAFAISFALVSLCFFVLNKQAFGNYYFLSFGALCVGLSSAAHELNRDFAAVEIMT